MVSKSSKRTSSEELGPPRIIRKDKRHQRSKESLPVQDSEERSFQRREPKFNKTKSRLSGRLIKH